MILQAGSMNIKGRPRPDGVLSPKLEIAIIHNWMFNFVAEYRPRAVLSLFFGGEFCRMYTDNRHLPSEFAFDFPQLRKQVHTVNSTIGPEIQNHQPAAQFLEGERSGSMFSQSSPCVNSGGCTMLECLRGLIRCAPFAIGPWASNAAN